MGGFILTRARQFYRAKWFETTLEIREKLCRAPSGKKGRLDRFGTLSKKRDATLRVLNRILHSLFRSIGVCFFGCGFFRRFFWNSSEQAFEDRTSRGLRSCCAAASTSDQNHTANIISDIPARVPIIYPQECVTILDLYGTLIWLRGASCEISCRLCI